MTDRVRVLQVILDQDYRDDDVGPIVSAVGMVKGVAEVKPMVVFVADLISRNVARIELQQKVFEAIRTAFEQGK